MTGDNHGLAGVGANLTADAVGKADGGIEQRPLARSLPIGHGSLGQVAEAVKLVRTAFLAFPTGLARARMYLRGIARTGRVQVAIGFLGGHDEGDEAVNVALQALVGVSLQAVGGPFDDFIDVAVVVLVLRQFVVGRGMGRTHKIVDTSRLFALAESQGDGHVAAGLQAGVPETVVHLHRGEGHRRDGVID